MRFLVGVALATCVVGCVDPGRRAEEFFGKESWSVMEKADKLEGFRVVPLAPMAGKVDPKGFVRGGVRIVGAPMDPGEDWLKLFALIEDPRSYDWGTKPAKAPVPEVLFRFITEDKREADLLICFAENMVSLGSSNPKEEGRWVSFLPARRRYVELVRRVFVLDQFVRSLKGGEDSPPLKWRTAL